MGYIKIPRQVLVQRHIYKPVRSWTSSSSAYTFQASIPVRGAYIPATEPRSGSNLHPFILSSPVTLVPGPAFSAGSGAEVSTAQVHDARGEAQQATVSVGPVHPGGGGRQTVLLVGTGQEVQRPVLQVGRLLDELSVKDQVRSGCRGASSQLIMHMKKISLG